MIAIRPSLDLGLVAIALVLLPAVRTALRPTDDPTVRAIATLTIFKVLETIVGGSMTDDRMMWGMVMIMLVIGTGYRHHLATHAAASRT